MIDFLNQDSDKLLNGCHPQIKTGNMLFWWMILDNPMAEDLLLCGQTPGEKGDQASGVKEDLKHETPSTLIEGDAITDPLLEELGFWGMAKDFPLKMSG